MTAWPDSWNGADPPPDRPGTTPCELQRRLHTSTYIALRDVRCIRDAGVVVLYGRVPTYFLKQLAQEIVRQTDGDCRIVNELEVDGQLAGPHPAECAKQAST